MEVSITQEDIDRGTPSSLTHCAYGVAIRRVTGEHKVFVYRDYCMVGDKRYELPLDARTKMIDYDLDTKLEPFTFNLVAT